MQPTRVILLGGFLGAGKTTLVSHLLQRLAAEGKRAAVVTNDQAAGLVDTALLARQAEGIGEVAGACFCCSFDNFLSELKRLDHDLAPDLLIGEPVGSCTDLAATVINPLRKLYADVFRVAPYSVLLDPSRFRDAFAPPDQRPFPDDVAYIYRLQLEEADALLINKADLLAAGEEAAIRAEVERWYPGRPLFVISAATGQGIDAWLAYALASEAAGHTSEVDYDRYASGEAALAWLNATVEATASNDTDWSCYAHSLLDEVRRRLTGGGAEIAHAKVFLSAATGSLAGNLTSNEGSIVIRGNIPPIAREVSVLVNIRARTQPEVMQEATVAAMESLGVRRQVRKLDCFSPSRPTPTHRMTEAS